MEQVDPTPLEQLLEDGAVIRDGHSKPTSIIRSSMAIVSIISSLLIIWMIRRSRVRLSTTYHRLLLGMSIADIFFSLGLATFNSPVPSDVAYVVWNARGNQATCNAQGYILFLGATCGLIYTCSLNVYYVVVVKCQKSDSYIRRKIEPYLHAVPIIYALVCSTTMVAQKNINSDGMEMCFVPIYEPKHCIGYEDGEIREGFEIPCGRGRDGAATFAYIGFFSTLFLVPVVVGISLGLIYQAVLRQEKTMERYCHNTSRTTQQLSQSDDRAVTTGRFNMSAILRRPQSSSMETNQERSKSRAVMHRALAYSIAYFLTWSLVIIRMALQIAGIDWPVALWYLASIVNPLQGFYNLLIFLQPKVSRAKRDDISWCQAFAAVLVGTAPGTASGQGNNNNTRPNGEPSKSSDPGGETFQSDEDGATNIVPSGSVAVRRRSSEIV